MQQPSVAADPAKPIDPTQPPSAASAVPEPAQPDNIPELGITGKASGAPRGEIVGTPGATPTPTTGTAPKTGTPEDRATEFVAVEGGGETTSAEALLVTPYVVMWGLLLAFVWLTWRRQQRVETRVVDLERALSRAELDSARAGAPRP